MVELRLKDQRGVGNAGLFVEVARGTMAESKTVGSVNLAGRDLLRLSDLSPAELSALLAQAAELKRDPYRADLRGRVLGLLFQKASTRTRVSFTAAMAQCGGSTLDLVPTALQVSRGEPLPDTARVLSRYLDVIAIRTYDQRELEIFAEYAEIPVINALTDQFHPCQVLADLLTIQENFGQLAGLTLAYCGDGNNVAHSLLLGCAMSGIHIRVATPPVTSRMGRWWQKHKPWPRDRRCWSYGIPTQQSQELRWSIPTCGPAWAKRIRPRPAKPTSCPTRSTPR